MEILPYFDAANLNRRIKGRRNKIKYSEIKVESESTKEGLIHITEKHICDIIEAYCKLVLNCEGNDNVGEYKNSQDLPDNFGEYARNLEVIAEELSGFQNLFFKDRFAELTALFYSNADIRELKDQYTGKDKTWYDKKIEKLRRALEETRNLIGENIGQKVYTTLLEVLGKVASDPDKIWRDKDKHIYISSYRFGKNERMLMFVAEDDGRLVTAFKRHPLFKQDDGVTYIIYRKESK
jgi:hypothetical protein